MGANTCGVRKICDFQQKCLENGTTETHIIMEDEYEVACVLSNDDIAIYLLMTLSTPLRTPKLPLILRYGSPFMSLSY